MFPHWRILLALGAVGAGLVALVEGRAIEHPPGVLVPDEPTQRLVRRAPFAVGEYELTPLAEFELEARVLSVEQYRMDRGARLSPVDFALGWGPMSDSAVLSHFRISQGARFFTVYPDERAIDLQTAMLNASNMHLIPADGTLKDRLQGVRPGSIVHLRGQLVSVRGPNNFTWKSSLTRADRGDGACELFYVESMEKR